MNHPIKKFVAVALAAGALAVAASAIAQQAPKPEKLITWRQSAFQVVGWSFGRVKANVEGQYNKDEVVKAANVIAAVSNSSLSTLFAPGTETGKGTHETAAKPEVFKDTEKFAEAFGNFKRESNELAKVAATGDAAAVKEQFGKVGRTCKGCHDDFKAKE